MKSLVVYYSRTGHTAKIAQELADVLECDIEKIIDTKKREGVLGYLRSARDAGSKSQTVLKDPINDPSNYDLLIIGTPLWAGHVSTPVRTYMQQNQEKINKVALFCTAGGDKFSGAFDDMKELSKKSPIATLGVRAKEIKDETYKSRLEEFVKALQM
ncbi:MAG: flavodoxin family protein [Methanothermobacter sp.]